MTIPLSIELSFLQKEHSEFFVDAGLYVAYWCYSSYKCSSTDMFGEQHKWSKNRVLNKVSDNRIEMGFIGGAGYNYNLSPMVTCFALVHYQYALIRQYKKSQSLYFLSPNNAITFQLGILYNINKR